MVRKGISLSSPSLDLAFSSAALRRIDSGAGLAESLSTDRLGGVALRNDEGIPFPRQVEPRIGRGVDRALETSANGKNPALLKSNPILSEADRLNDGDF